MRDHRGANDVVFLRQPKLLNHVDARLRRLQAVPAGRRAEIDFAVGIERRSADDRSQQLDFLDELSLFGIDDIEIAAVVGDIDPAIDEDRRAFPFHDAAQFPDIGLAGRVTRPASLERQHHPLSAIVEVLLGLAHVNRVAHDQRRDIQATSGHAVVPDRLAGSRLKRPDRSVA